MYDVRINLNLDSGPKPESPQYYPPDLSVQRKPELFIFFNRLVKKSRKTKIHYISVMPAKTQSLIKPSNYCTSAKNRNLR